MDPVLGLQGLAVAGINEVIDGLRTLPVLGGFFSMWPEIEPISFRATQTSAYAVITMVTWQWTPFAVDLYDIAAIRRSATKRGRCTDGAGTWSQFRF